jgi:hypothetical protein
MRIGFLLSNITRQETGFVGLIQLPNTQKVKNGVITL